MEEFPKGGWLSLGEKLPERVPYTIGVEKSMLTVLESEWFRDGGSFATRR
jgi:hypothetical protein